MVQTVDVRAVVPGALVCLFLLIGGCASGSGKPVAGRVEAEPSESGVKLAFDFMPGQTTTYKLTTQNERAVSYSGDVPEMSEELKGGRTGNRIEMVFSQHVESVDGQGSAVLKITIEKLTYIGQSRDKMVLDFDSSRAADANSPLAKLIGQSYKLTMSPTGRVLAIDGVRPIRAAVAGNQPANQTAQKLLSDEAIEERHAVTALIAAQGRTVHEGDTWNDVKVVSFGSMGTDTLNQIYKLAAIDRGDDRRVAVIEMEGIPSAAMAQQLHEQGGASPNPGVLENAQEDKGLLRLDLTNQRIDEYTEDQTKEWVTVLPAQSSGGGFVAMRMTATERYKLERVE